MFEVARGAVDVRLRKLLMLLLMVATDSSYAAGSVTLSVLSFRKFFNELSSRPASIYRSRSVTDQCQDFG